jgi:hypothetical protein
MKTTLALLFLSMVSASAGQGASTTTSRQTQSMLECADGTELASVSIFLDGNPSDTGYSLVCVSGGDIWDVAPGDIPSPTRWVEDFACVGITDYCVFSIYDATGDGLLDDGWYTLNFGATTIATYDYSPFDEKTYCFGSGCAETPLELAEVECDPVFLGITFDSSPEDVGIFLACNNEVKWSYPVSSFGSDYASQFLTLEECVSPDACCTFTITDSANDGLTAPAVGSFELEVAYETATHYDGASGLNYGALSYNFGSGC